MDFRQGHFLARAAGPSRARLDRNQTPLAHARRLLLPNLNSHTRHPFQRSLLQPQLLQDGRAAV